MKNLKLNLQTFFVATLIGVAGGVAFSFLIEALIYLGKT